MNEYIMFWRHGEKSSVFGNDISEAVNSNYSSGAMRALDFWCPKESASDYYWNKELKEWKSKKIEAMFP